MIAKRVLLCTNFVADFVVGNVFFSVKFCFSIAAFFHGKQYTKFIGCSFNMAVFTVILIINAFSFLAAPFVMLLDFYCD